MTAAGARSLRDTVAQAWLFDARIRQGDLTGALANADAVLRTRPDLSGRFVPAMAAIVRDAAGEKALVNALTANPPWRSWLMQTLPGAVDPSVMLGMLSDLQAQGDVDANDLRPYLNQLVATGQFEVGYLAWLHFLPESGADQAITYAYNGDFERGISNLPFDWSVSEIKGARTDIVETGQSSLGKALRVTFSDTRVPYANLSKLMILPPGTYQLTGMVRTDQLKNERGLAWNVYCADGEKLRVGGTQLFQGTFDWEPFSTTFAIPTSGCEAQWLKLELGAKAVLEQQISGEIWFDRLAVNRTAAPPTPAVTVSAPPPEPGTIPTITLQ
jgi:hypothetical protein